MLIQRLSSFKQKEDWYIDSIVKIIKENPNSCSEVWFASDYGYPTLETHAKTAQTIKESAKKFEEIGVGVSLQISNTIGHGAYMSSYDCTGLVYEGSPVGKLVGHDGTVAEYCFCPNDSYFRNYVVSFCKEYAGVRPLKIWIDDDLRYTNHAPVRFGCFCDKCIGDFNKKHGTGFTRETLVQEINYGDKAWREKYMDHLRAIMYDFVYEMSKAVHEISPETVMCLQYGPNRGFTGYDHHHILGAMRDATGHIPETRPGGGAYEDSNINDFFRKSHDLEFLNHTLPDYVVEKLPEVENLPDVMFGKTIAGTCFETSLNFARGSTGMTYAAMMRSYESMDWHGELLAAFSRHYDYWKKLSEYNYGTRHSGIVLAFPKKFYLSDTKQEFSWNSEPRETGGWELEKCAIPVGLSHDTTSTYFLHYNCASRMTREELEELFDKPVMTDGETVSMLCDMGYDFGLKPERINVLRLSTEYSDHICNKDFSGKKWMSKPFGASEGYKFEELSDGCEVLETYVAEVFDENSHKTASVITTAPRGGRWAVFGNCLWNYIISSNKRDQILNVAEYLNPGRMLARLITPAKCLVAPRETSDGKLKHISVLNCTAAKSGALEFKVRSVVGKKAFFMSQYNGECSVELLPCDDGFTVKMPSIDAFSVGTVFFE